MNLDKNGNLIKENNLDPSSLNYLKNDCAKYCIIHFLLKKTGHIIFLLLDKHINTITYLETDQK